MPAPTLDQLKQRETALKRTLAEQGESMDPAKRRGTHKTLRRTQRKRREMVAHGASHGNASTDAPIAPGGA